MNQQAIGPLCGNPQDLTRIDASDGSSVLVLSEWLGTSVEGCATAILARNAYNAFDRAARELGVDAIELAESIDIAALVRRAVATSRDMEHATAHLKEYAKDNVTAQYVAIFTHNAGLFTKEALGSARALVEKAGITS